jgi:hypothetical protein
MANIRISFFGTRYVSYVTKDLKLNWWLCFNALAVDTVLIAIVWQSLAAKVFDIELEHCHRILLGAAVWLGYVADRVLDGFQITDRVCSARHSIAFRYRVFLFFAWVAVLFLAVCFAFHVLPFRELYKCFLLAICCGLNSLVNVFDKFGKFPIPKELRTALLFASGVFIFVAFGFPEITIWSWITFLSFATLCFANCFYAAIWDRTVDMSQGQSSLILRRNLPLAPLRLISLLMAFGCILLSVLLSGNLNLFFLAIGSALLSLPLIDILINGTENKRILADLGLLLSAGCVLL